MVNKGYVPQLVSSYSYIPFDKNVYTLCIDNELESIKLNISQFTKELLDEIDGEKSIEEVTSTFNRKFDSNFTVDDIVNIFNKQLLGYGILEGDNTEKIKVKDDYLKFRITLIPSNVVRKITPIFTWLFDKKLFAFMFTLCSVFLLAMFLLHLDFKQLYYDADPELIALFFFINYASLMFHEFGHAAACDKFGAKSGNIGFGFYILTPVFYSDVTDAWRLTRKERLIVDLGGVYIQLIISAIIILIYLVTLESAYLYMAFMMGVVILFNLNPFLRYDGYWAISDMLNISNLKDKSMKAAGTLYGWCIGINKNWDHIRNNIFLTVYGVLRSLVLILFILYMVIFNSNSILYFPVMLYEFVSEIITNPEIVSFRWVKEQFADMFIPLLFYYILFKSLYAEVKRRLRKPKPENLNHA